MQDDAGAILYPINNTGRGRLATSSRRYNGIGFLINYIFNWGRRNRPLRGLQAHAIRECFSLSLRRCIRPGAMMCRSCRALRDARRMIGSNGARHHPDVAAELIIIARDSPDVLDERKRVVPRTAWTNAFRMERFRVRTLPKSETGDAKHR